MPRVLITGCSRGIGRESAVRMSQEGWEVVATLRSDEGRRELEEYNIQVVTLDVSDEARVTEVINEAAGSGLDALVANAGYGLHGAFEMLDPADIRALFDTNVFGAMACARAALPHLRASRGRLVVVSSLAGRRAAPCSSMYNASKFAVEGWAEGLRLELAHLGVPVVLIQPGATRTGFRQALVRREGFGSGVYAALENRLAELHAASWGSADDSVIVVDAIHRALTARRPPLRMATGRNTHIQLTAFRALPWRIWEAMVRRKLDL